MGKRANRESIEQFVLENVEGHPGDIAALTAVRFGFSRQAAHHHLRRMVEAGLLDATGRTRDRRYSLAVILEQTVDLPVGDNREEDVVWRQHVAPHLGGLPDNVQKICQHGFTEIYNNVVDHAEASRVYVVVTRTAISVSLSIADNGIGIFRKIQTELGLPDSRDAALQLAKGKLTTDPASHTGEGIFFASRMFDKFVIVSDTVSFVHEALGDDWLLEDRRSSTRGTGVAMKTITDCPRTVQQVFDEFAAPGDYAFSRTHVPVILAQHGGENLVSRSQARRVLARFEQFKEVILDFHEVKSIGQAFADEIFRVFSNAHPEIKLLWINASAQVEGMVRRALAGRDEAQPKPFE